MLYQLYQQVFYCQYPLNKGLIFICALSVTPHLNVTCDAFSHVRRWHTGVAEQRGFAVMDVAERLNDLGPF